MVPVLGSVLFLATICISASLPPPKAPKGPGFVTVPLTAVNKSTVPSRKRQDYGTPLFNSQEGTAYIAHISIGTPPQPVYLLLDTGSSELWVDPNCATANNAAQTAICNSNPVYDPNTSSTAVDQGYPFSLSYGKGSASGEYLTDTFYVGGATITGLQFGWADATQAMETGIIAVGYGVEITGYYCIIDEMYLEGTINSRAFSLDLGSVDSPEGSILFGGIDTMKYTGPLEKRPMIPYNDAPDGNIRYWIYMTSVGITKPGSTTSKVYTVPSYNQAVVLDSGSTISTLPQNLVSAMLADFTGVSQPVAGGLYLVDCNQATLSGTLDFGFGNTVIHVPYHQFIWIPNPGSGYCYFGAVGADPSTNNVWILGDTVLRSTYAVFDQDNGNILVANYVNCGTNIVPIGSGANAVPSITGGCSPTISPVSSTSTSKTSSTIVKTTSSSISKSSSKSTSSSVKTTTTSSSKLTSSSVKTTTTSSSSSKRTSSSISSQKSSSTTTQSSKSSSHSTISTSVKSPSTTSSIKTTLATTTSKKSSSSVAGSTTSPTATKTLGYAYVGCFKDSSPHSLTKLVSNSSMSVELCLEIALQAVPPYPYAGVEYKNECWAALTSPAAATPTSGSGACADACAGNAKESCGGGGMFNLYYSAAATTSA